MAYSRFQPDPGEIQPAGTNWHGYTRAMNLDLHSSAGPGHEPDGDVALVRWMVSLTPAERLEVLQGFVDSVSELRRDQSAPVQRRA